MQSYIIEDCYPQNLWITLSLTGHISSEAPFPAGVESN